MDILVNPCIQDFKPPTVNGNFYTLYAQQELVLEYQKPVSIHLGFSVQVNYIRPLSILVTPAYDFDKLHVFFVGDVLFSGNSKNEISVSACQMHKKSPLMIARHAPIAKLTVCPVYNPKLVISEL